MNASLPTSINLDILDSIKSGIYFFKDGKFIFVNREMENITGYSREELLEMNPFDLIHPEDIDAKEKLVEYTSLALGGTLPPPEIELRIRRKDGETRYVVLRPSIVGQMIVGNAHDITEKKLMELKLREKEESFRLISENSLFGIFIFQDDYFVYVNPTIEKITGYSREELYRMHFWDLVHPDFKDVVKERGRKRQKREVVEPFLYEIPFYTKSGELRWGIFSFSNTIYMGRPAGFCAVMNITDKKYLEKKLQRSEEMYRNLWDSVSDSIILIDREGSIVECNRKTCEIIGLKKEEIIGRSIFEFLSDDITEYMKHKIEEGFNNIISTEEVKINLNGSELWFEVTGSLIEGEKPLLQIIGREITERKRFEKMLRESEEKFRTLVEKSVAGVYFIQDGLFKYVNPKLAEIWGYSVDEMIGRRVLDFIHPDSREEVTENLRKRISGEAKSINYTIRILTKSGETKFIEVFGSRAVIGGRPAVIGTLIDVTDLKRSEEKYRAVFDHSPVLIGILDGNGVFIDSNREFEETLGENPTGKSLFDLFPKKVAESRLRFIKRALESNSEVNFIDEFKGYFSFTVVPVDLPEGRYCMMIGKEITDLVNLNKLLGLVSDVNKAIVHERDYTRLLKKICKILTVYNCCIIFETGEGIYIPPGEIEASEFRCMRARDILASDEMLISAPEFRIDCSECRVLCPVKDKERMFILPLADEVNFGTIMLFKNTEFYDYEVEILRTMSRDIVFGLKTIDMDLQRQKAYEQINKNIEYFAYLVDAIRNPLMIILGLSETIEHESSKIIMEQIVKIDNVIKKLDQGWLETEKVRDFLRHHPGNKTRFKDLDFENL